MRRIRIYAERTDAQPASAAPPSSTSKTARPPTGPFSRALEAPDEAARDRDLEPEPAARPPAAARLVAGRGSDRARRGRATAYDSEGARGEPAEPANEAARTCRQQARHLRPARAQARARLDRELQRDAARRQRPTRRPALRHADRLPHDRRRARMA